MRVLQLNSKEAWTKPNGMLMNRAIIPNAPTGLGSSVWFTVVNKTPEKDYKPVMYGAGSCRDTFVASIIGQTDEELLYKGKASIAVMAQQGNIENAVKLLHYVEEQLKVPTKTILYATQKNKWYILRIDPYWIQRTYILSLYSLLLRMGIRGYYSGTPQAFLDSYRADYWNQPETRAKYKYFVEKGPWLSTMDPEYTRHGSGFVSVSIPDFVLSNFNN